MTNTVQSQQRPLEDQYIFCVGRPDHASLSIERIHKLGYKAGIFADSRILSSIATDYDAIVPVDFSSLLDTIDDLRVWRDKVKGLICTYENYIVSKAHLGVYFNVPALSIEAANIATDKLAMRTAFAKNPAISPAFREVSSIDEAIHFANTYGYPVITKPTNLVKSLLVTRCDTEDELRKTIQHMQTALPYMYEKYSVFSHSPQIIIEEFITGPMYSIAGFVDTKGEIHFSPGVTALISAQMVGRDDNYLYNRTLPASVNEKTSNDLKNVVQEGVIAMGLRSTPIHAELIEGKTGIKIVEIGARIGGYRPRMYNLSYDIDLIELDIRNSLDRPLPIPLHTSTKKITSTYEIFADQEGVFAQIDGPLDIVRSDSVYFSQKIHKGDRTGRAADGHKAAVIIIQTHESAKVATQAASYIDQIKIEVE